MTRPADINYFAYGTPCDPDMIRAIIGREPSGEQATLSDYQMTVQNGLQIPEDVRTMLATNWTPEELRKFESYAIAPRIGQLVVGTLWKLTSDERKIVDNWELNDGLWYKKLDLEVTTQKGPIMATTETINDYTLPEATKLHPDMPLYLADKARMLEIATKVRHEYLARQQT